MTPADYDRPVGPPFASRSPVFAPHVMAATSQPLATQAALDIMRRGGNAVDAAIAANAVQGLTEPTGCGIGGDLYAIAWIAAERRLVGLNASGRSPAGLTLEALRGMGIGRIPSTGPLSVSVPGAVDGWCELSERHGKLPLSEVLAPATELAREGFPVTPVVAHEWAASAARLGDYPGFAGVFMPGGRAPTAGERFANPALAHSYELIGAGGRDAFYEGELPRRIAEYLAAHGGFLTAQDFASHRAEWVEPLSVSYRGHEVWELPPNGQGITVLQMLNILEGFDLASMGAGSADYVHHLVEAKKLAWEDRARLIADPDFAAAPLQQLLSDDYAARRRALIDPRRAASPPDPGLAERGDTINLATADADGNMVSLIQSNFHGMGSGMTPPGLGFVLQNRGELFSLDPSHANCYAPRKRPFQTIIPGFVTRGGEPLLAFGVMGAAMQPQGHVQVLVNMIDFGMDLQAAGDAPRVFHTGTSEPTGERASGGGTVHLERGIPAAVRDALAARGHALGDARGVFGGYQAVQRDARSGCWIGASEPRKDGQAAGY